MIINKMSYERGFGHGSLYLTARAALHDRRHGRPRVVRPHAGPCRHRRAASGRAALLQGRQAAQPAPRAQCVFDAARPTTARIITRSMRATLAIVMLRLAAALRAPLVAGGTALRPLGELKREWAASALNTPHTDGHGRRLRAWDPRRRRHWHACCTGPSRRSRTPCTWTCFAVFHSNTFQSSSGHQPGSRSHSRRRTCSRCTGRPSRSRPLVAWGTARRARPLGWCPRPWCCR